MYTLAAAIAHIPVANHLSASSAMVLGAFAAPCPHHLDRRDACFDGGCTDPLRLSSQLQAPKVAEGSPSRKAVQSRLFAIVRGSSTVPERRRCSLVMALDANSTGHRRAAAPPPSASRLCAWSNRAKSSPRLIQLQSEKVAHPGEPLDERQTFRHAHHDPSRTPRTSSSPSSRSPPSPPTLTTPPRCSRATSRPSLWSCRCPAARRVTPPPRAPRRAPSCSTSCAAACRRMCAGRRMLRRREERAAAIVEESWSRPTAAARHATAHDLIRIRLDEAARGGGGGEGAQRRGSEGSHYSLAEGQGRPRPIQGDVRASRVRR